MKICCQGDGTINNLDRNFYNSFLGHRFVWGFFGGGGSLYFFKIFNQNQHYLIRSTVLYVSSTCLFFFLLVLASGVCIYSQSWLVLERNVILLCLRIRIFLIVYKNNKSAICSARSQVYCFAIAIILWFVLKRCNIPVLIFF